MRTGYDSSRERILSRLGGLTVAQHVLHRRKAGRIFYQVGVASCHPSPSTLLCLSPDDVSERSNIHA